MEASGRNCIRYEVCLCTTYVGGSCKYRTRAGDGSETQESTTPRITAAVSREVHGILMLQRARRTSAMTKSALEEIQIVHLDIESIKMLTMKLLKLRYH